MAITKTIIINKALTLVGAARVDSIEDGSNSADVLNSLYETALKSVLSECKWNFATKRCALATNSTVTLAFYDQGQGIVYDKPTDIVRIFEVNDQFAQWREEGDYIISDTADLAIRYVYYLDEPSSYPVYFVEALVDKLASDIAYIIVNSATLAQTMLQKYERVTLPKARAANSQTGVQQALRDDAWELSKYNDVNDTA